MQCVQITWQSIHGLVTYRKYIFQSSNKDGRDVQKKDPSVLEVGMLPTKVGSVTSGP